MLCGIQPAFLDEYLPANAWELGFMSRVVPVLSTEKLDKPLLLEGNRRVIHSFDLMTQGLQEIFELAGEFSWTKESTKLLTSWRSYEGPEPIPASKKLSYYNGRRSFNIIKLSMIAAASRTKTLVVELEDLLRAKQWLLDAETGFTQLFNIPKAKSDGKLIAEIADFAKLYSSRPMGDSKNIRAKDLWEFLSKQISADKIPGVIHACEEAGVLKKLIGIENIWIPGEADGNR
jgi:hypothetical protein